MDGGYIEGRSMEIDIVVGEFHKKILTTTDLCGQTS